MLWINVFLKKIIDSPMGSGPITFSKASDLLNESVYVVREQLELVQQKDIIPLLSCWHLSANMLYFRCLHYNLLIICLYKTSTYPLLNLYCASTSQTRTPYSPIRGTCQQKAPLIEVATFHHPTLLHLFPAWERFIPNLGTFHSQRGNSKSP